MSEKRRALVTGANGFVGKIMCARFEARGWELRKGVYGEHSVASDELAFDVSRREYVEYLLDWAGPVTHVFHCAAQTFVPDAIRIPATSIAVNLEGTIHLVEALRTRGSDARFIFIGSAGAYGQPATSPVIEDHPLCPLNPYDISKAAADQYCAFVSGSTGMDIVRTRPFNHCGRGQTPKFALPAFARQLARIEADLAPPKLEVGDLDKRRDFLHVDDVVDAYELLALKGQSGEVYNVCSGRSRAIGEGLDALLALSTADVEVVVRKDLLRAIDAPDVVGSHDRLTEQTGWRPVVPFEKILSDQLEEWRERVAQGDPSEA